MYRTKRRRALASVILVSAVLLLPVQPAGAAPRGGGERESVRASLGILAHWEHQVWSFLIRILEKAGSNSGDHGNAANPDGAPASSSLLSMDGGH